jgi:urocanate hydratase
VFRTHADAPRVLIANSNLVPRWANWEHFSELDRKGLMMYGQMTAGSWIYIGTQGIVQGTYETFAEAGRSISAATSRGRWILTAGLGGMGGAQPLAGVFAGACVLAVECQPSRIEKRMETRYLDQRADGLTRARDDPPRDGGAAGDQRRPARERGGGLPGARAARHPARHRDRPDERARPRERLPAAGWTVAEWAAKAGKRSAAVAAAAKRSMVQHVQAMLDFQDRGAKVLDYGNNIRQLAKEEGLADAFGFPGSCRPISARSSAAGSAPSAGRPSPAIGGHLPDGCPRCGS